MPVIHDPYEAYSVTIDFTDKNHCTKAIRMYDKDGGDWVPYGEHGAHLSIYDGCDCDEAAEYEGKCGPECPHYKAKEEVKD